MSKNSDIKIPPRRESKKSADANTDTSTKFKHIAENDIVQFNKHIKKGVADSYAMLAISTNIKIPQLLEEGAALLKEKYGKV